MSSLSKQGPFSFESVTGKNSSRKRNIFLLGKDTSTVPCGKYEKRRFILRTQKSIYSTCLQFPNARSPAVITQRAGQTSFCQYYMCKSVPSLSENLGVQALSEFGVVTFLAEKKKKTHEWAMQTHLKWVKNKNFHNRNLFQQKKNIYIYKAYDAPRPSTCLKRRGD